MFNPNYYYNSLEGGIGVLEIVSGDLSAVPGGSRSPRKPKASVSEANHKPKALVNEVNHKPKALVNEVNTLKCGSSAKPQADKEKEQPRLFVPLKRTELRGEVTGPLASLRINQTYSYSKEQCDKVLEAFYRFPLPGDIAVTQVFVTFGDVEIIAELKERQKAEADYEEAVRFLEEHRDSGGTELGVALEQALGIERADGERARHLLIVTDVQVTDAGRILRLADQESKQKDRRRISVLCIDAAPNSFVASDCFVPRNAERGGGVAKFLTSSPYEKDISTALDEVLADWAEPVLAGLRLSVNCSNVQAAGREVIGTEARERLINLGELPAGRTIWVAGRALRGETKDLAFRVTTKDNQEVAACRLDLAKEASEHNAIKALFGARRVMGLEFLIHSGYDQKDLREQLERLGYDSEKVLSDLKGKPPKVYAENVRAETTEALRGLLVKEALSYGLACSETAFVAVRREAGKPVEASVAVANALPAGWSDEFLSVPLRMGRAKRISTSVAQPMEYMECVDMAQPVMCLRMAAMSPSPHRASVSLMRETPAAPSPSTTTVLFSGIPKFADGEAILFDTSRDQDTSKLPDGAVINRLEVRFPCGESGGTTAFNGTPEHENLAGLSLLIFVDDLSSPKAKVHLADVVRQRGERPLNLLRRPGQVVRLVLLDLDGLWPQTAPRIEVALGWKAMGG